MPDSTEPGSHRESERAAERRREREAPHDVLDYVAREHSMNGRPCENPWAVIRTRHTGNVSFYCGECGVSIGIGGGQMYDELMERWGGCQNTNPDAHGYPAWDHIGPVTRGVYLRSDRVYHCPPDRMGGPYTVGGDHAR